MTKAEQFIRLQKEFWLFSDSKTFKMMGDDHEFVQFA